MEERIIHPEWITLRIYGRLHVGYDQDWYPEKWQQLAGCGPTAGTVMAAYIERKQRRLAIHTVEEARKKMMDLWPYATPRMHGLYKTRWLREGLEAYLRDQGLAGKVEALSVPSIRFLAPKLPEAAAFIREGLAADCPIGFLNLHSGGEPIPYHWHWMVIVGIREEKGQFFCRFWDSGKEYTFNLGNWIANTRFGGGFVRALETGRTKE
ncbi:MAG: hypothetical protein SPI25_04980 [Dialister sp.]|nr:hypothetical protein [Dialister sp.]